MCLGNVPALETIPQSAAQPFEEAASSLSGNARSTNKVAAQEPVFELSELSLGDDVLLPEAAIAFDERAVDVSLFLDTAPALRPRARTAPPRLHRLRPMEAPQWAAEMEPFELPAPAVALEEPAVELSLDLQNGSPLRPIASASPPRLPRLRPMEAPLWAAEMEPFELPAPAVPLDDPTVDVHFSFNNAPALSSRAPTGPPRLPRRRPMETPLCASEMEPFEPPAAAVALDEPAVDQSRGCTAPTLSSRTPIEPPRLPRLRPMESPLWAADMEPFELPAPAVALDESAVDVGLGFQAAPTFEPPMSTLCWTVELEALEASLEEAAAGHGALMNGSDGASGVCMKSLKVA